MKIFILLTRTLLCCGFLFWMTAESQAQTSSNAAGGDASSLDGSVSFSLGQVFYTAEANSSGNINQGVQQPIEIYSTSVDESLLDFQVTAFPNPTVREVSLSIPDFAGKKLSYGLTDVHGRALDAQMIEGQLTKISLNQVSSGTYFLTLSLSGQPIKTFTIIKK